MLTFVGQGCATNIRQIDHHNIGIKSDTIADALFISSSLASLLDFPSSLSISEQAVRNTVKPQFELRNPYGLSVSRAYKNRATKVLQLAALTIGDE
jgi:hypothetical protein